jgi:hypothetical protein
LRLTTPVAIGYGLLQVSQTGRRKHESYVHKRTRREMKLIVRRVSVLGPQNGAATAAATPAATYTGNTGPD